MKALALCCTLIAAALIGTSCKTTMYIPAGKADTGYLLSRGTDAWEVFLEKDLNTVKTATEEGLNDMKVKTFESKMENGSGVVKGTYPDGTAVNVEIAQLTDKLTEVHISVGAANPPEKVREVFKAIQKKLPMDDS